MMYRILIVHNKYQYAGGEDTVVQQDAELLRKHGHEVFIYTRNNDELKHYSKWQKLCLPFTTFFSLRSYREIRKEIRKNKIDIVHVHNTLPLISYSAYYAAKREHVKLFQTIHNFRLVCPNGIFYRDGHICEECLTKGLQMSIKHGCYRNSRVQTAVVAISLKLHRIFGTFDKPDAYIALTEFNKQEISNIVKSEKIVVKPNYLNIRIPKVEEAADKTESYFVYAARLEKAKGIFVLLEALKDLPDVHLIVLGTGPDEEEVRKYIEEHDMRNVECKGFVSHEEVLRYICNARAVIYPSLWYEGFPMTIVESFACGTPVIVSDTPNLSETIQNQVNGWKFSVGNVERLREIIVKISGLESEQMVELSKAAYMTYEKKFTEQTVYQKLMKIYSMEE